MMFSVHHKTVSVSPAKVDMTRPICGYHSLFIHLSALAFSIFYPHSYPVYHHLTIILLIFTFSFFKFTFVVEFFTLTLHLFTFCIFLPLKSMGTSKWVQLRQRISTGKTKKKQKAKPNSEKQKEKETPCCGLSFPCNFYCPAGLHIMYAHPQSSSETKGRRDNREIDRWKKRKLQKVRGEKKAYKQDTVQFSYSYNKVSVRGSLSPLLSLDCSTYMSSYP